MTKWHEGVFAQRKLVRVILGALLVATVLCSGCASSSKGKVSDKERAEMLLDIANGALLESDPTTALNYLREAEKLDNSLPGIYHSMAVAFAAKKERKIAIENARKALSMKEDYPDAQTTLGKLLLDDGQFAEAEKYLMISAANPFYRDAFRARTSLGILYYRRGDYTKALEQLDRAIEAAPTASCIAYYYRGHIRLTQSKSREAIRDYERATQRFCATFVQAHMALGVAYTRNKQYDLARKKFLEINQRFPKTTVAEQAMDRLRYLP